MLEVAAPLYRIGGYRAVLLLPMLGGVAAAFASRSIARRLDPASDGWLAFWVVGLGSPIVVYALDFWEHSAGVACVVGAVAVLLGILDRRPSWHGLAAGGLLGLGAVMRNEVLVYALVSVGLTCITLLQRTRRIADPLVVGATAVAGLGAAYLANSVLEASVGGLSRTSRATSTASAVASTASTRLGEAFQTSIGLVSGDAMLSALLGSGVVLAVLLAVRAERRADRRFAIVCLVAGAAVYVADAVGGLGFVPGLFIAFPLAILALVPFGRSPDARLVTAMALVALPLVYAFQYVGGAGPQWGGRYTLPSAVLLGVVGSVGLRDRLPTVGRGVIALSFGVTALGAGWVAVRSNGVDQFFDRLDRESAPVLVSRQAFLLREGGAEIVGRRWLSVSDEAGFTEAVGIARAVGVDEFSVLEWDGVAPPDTSLPDDVTEVRRTQLDFLGTPVGVVTHHLG